MKKIILLNGRIVNDFLRDLITKEYNRQLVNNPSMKQLHIEGYTDTNDVRTAYPEGLPKNGIVIIGPSFGVTQSKEIFDLFNDELKKHTIIAATEAMFGFEAIKEGFEHILSNDGEIKTFPDLARKIIDWVNE